MLYHAESGGTKEGPDYIALDQSGTSILESWTCDGSESISGSISGTDITLSFEQTGGTVILTGTIT